MENKILNVTIIAGNVHQLRLAANLTQSELAKLIHVSTSSINAWERGHTYPSLINVLSICNYFKVKVDDLIGVPSMKNQRLICYTLPVSYVTPQSEFVIRRTQKHD